MKRIALAVALGAVGLTAVPAALAHLAVSSSSPANGSTVKALPATVTVTVNSVVIKASSVSLKGPTGAEHAAGFKMDPKNRKRVLITTKNRTVAGLYRLSATITGADTHSIKVALSFRVKR